MRKVLLLAIAALLFSMNVVNAKEVQVKGYTKKDGTKVASYNRKVKAKDPTDGAMSTGAPSKDSEKKAK